MNSNGHYAEESWVETLRRQAEAKRKEYYEMAQEHRRIALRMEKAKISIEHLNSVLEDEGQAKVLLREQTQTSNVGKPGNRSKDIRRE